MFSLIWTILLILLVLTIFFNIPFQDSEVFEITDFTTASEWERFIAQLEEVIHEWKLVTIPKLPPLKKARGFIHDRCVL